ncbi:hypothetical protein PIROE2DRAFT_6284 [Piromyces sp. E2]|nr:hypothetical protein PIROE2DRAFT_6284 [Piromyces sp. E2]|eukprot:OUM66449.1 hypothetical protein PIROE2DRAFT_6284 [Piromyces sp. E2]
MKIEEIKEYVDHIANFVASKKDVLAGPEGLLASIIRKEIEFLIFLTIVYLITLVIKQRSKSMYKYLVSLTIAVIVLYTSYVSTIFDESIKQGKPTEDVIKGLPPVCICIIIRLFNIIPPLKLFYYALPLFMIAYSIYYHNLLSGTHVAKSKSKSKSKTRSRSHSNLHNKPKEKSLKDFIRISLALFTDFIHSFILFYAYAVLCLWKNNKIL